LFVFNIVYSQILRKRILADGSFGKKTITNFSKNEENSFLRSLLKIRGLVLRKMGVNRSFEVIKSPNYEKTINA
jgi:hypothetical protein